MDFIEGLLYMIWRGIAIGVLISAPMGPVGILCIQRTLDKGRQTGFYTGVGAALSDLFYCLLTGFGLSFIEAFLERNQNVIQLVGSAVLIGFSVYLFRKNPAKTLRKPSDTDTAPKKNVLTGFLFTFSNPLILFLIIGLFARFSFQMPDIRWFHYIIGYISIFAGALGWWWIVTFSIDKVRAHFNLRSMWLINRIIGVVILLFALVGIFTSISNIASASYWNRERGYLPFRHGSPSGIVLDNPKSASNPLIDSCTLDSPQHNFELHFRVDDQSRRPSAWGFFIDSAPGNDPPNARRIWVTAKPTEVSDGVSSEPRIEFTVDGVNGTTIPWAKSFYLKITSGDNDIEFQANGEVIYNLSTTGSISVNKFGFAAAPGTSIVVSDVALRRRGEALAAPAPDGTGIQSTVWTEPLLNEYFESQPPFPEGYWMVYDRALDESLLRMGGDYRMAIVKDNDRYLIIYLSGATVNATAWRPGMVKGYLYPTPFDGVYDTTWVDPSGRPMQKDIRAQREGENLLRIQFPYQDSILRLAKY